jgi:hypothetical protein
MFHVVKVVAPALLFGICLATQSGLYAQEPDGSSATVGSERDQTWYRQESIVRMDPRAIVIQKAQVRAAQRNARMASLQWYGMSNARPTAGSTPFMSMYSPVWQQPGGRPFAWSTASWPTSVVYVR